MVDGALLARRVAAVRDAVARIREVLPAEAERLEADRGAREIVVLNLLVAVQECLSLGTHWLADEGWEVPSAYGRVFVALADHGVIDTALATRLAAAAGLRYLIAHRYAELDTARLHRVASEDLDDLLAFCAALARRAGAGPAG